MIKFSYTTVKNALVHQLDFLKKHFAKTFAEAGGESWFHGLDSWERDQFVKECIDKHNALSPGATEEDIDNPENLNKALLEAVRYQNKLLSELIDELRKEK